MINFIGGFKYFEIYIYGDSNWPDKLTSYDGQDIVYDAIGNPLEYRGWEFEWSRGRRLDKVKNSLYNVNVAYKYDESGIRTQKIVNGVQTDFVTDGIKVLAQKTGNNTLIWQVDGNGNTVGFNYNGTPYFYMKNLQGDIIGITDTSGNIVAKYTYDSWGKLISIKDANDVDKTTDENFIGYINPLRYRGYYYDTETGLYYLNARYYDPEVGRFINADKTLGGGYNLFEYCYNSPANLIDLTGLEAKIDDYISKNYSGKITIDFLVKTPNIGGREVIDWNNNEVGHTFLRLDYGNGNVIYKGFYPKYSLSKEQIRNREDVLGKTLNDENHCWDIAQIYEISNEEADRVEDFINNYSEKYNMVSNNYTTFAVQALEIAGIRSPTSKYFWKLNTGFLGLLSKSVSFFPMLYGYTPSNAAQDIMGAANTVQFTNL